MKSFELGYAFVRCLNADEKTRVWETRKAGLGLLMGMKGDHKPVGFVEDAAVPIEHLPEYVRRFAKIVEDHDTTAAYYAHASVGLLPNSFEPTYTITSGLPGRSYTLAIASRMGIADEIIESARSMLGPTERNSEKILTELLRNKTNTKPPKIANGTVKIIING